MRTQFPTSLDQDEINQYIVYLGVVGGIFVIVACTLYVLTITFAIVSKKSKRFSTERIMKFHEMHARKAHISFIIVVILVFFLVVEAVIFGLVENSRLHSSIVTIAKKPTTVIDPAAQVVRNVNATVGNTGIALGRSIVLIENILDSVEQITYSIDRIYNNILLVQQQFNEIEKSFENATPVLRDTTDNLNTLATYQADGFITDVPDTSAVTNVDNTINSSISTATEYLNETIAAINTVLVTVNTTIADAVDTGNEQVAKAKDLLADKIGDVQNRLGNAVDSLGGPNATISSISKTAIHFGGIIEQVLIVVFVFALIPLALVFVGLIAKQPVLYKFAFAASFFCMFWLIAIGGVFAVVHTAFSQACDSREVLVINGIHKFTPDEYVVNLGNINVGGNNNGNTQIIISLNSSTLHNLLTCADPTNFFDVFGLAPLIDALFGQIYASLDQLQQQQAAFFDANSTSDINTINFQSQIGNTTDGMHGFANATHNLVDGSYLNGFYGMQTNMQNITQQASNLALQANETVDNALSGVNDVTKNVTTVDGDSFSYYYTIYNVSDLNVASYPFNSTTQTFQNQLRTASTQLQTAITDQGSIAGKVTAVTDAATNVLTDIKNFQEYLRSSLNISVDVNDTIDDIQKQLDYVSNLIPQLYKNITDAINSVRDVLHTVSDSLRKDTQCGFAGEFFETFSAKICRTGRKNAQAMTAALLIMGIAYFFVCVLGIGLLKRNDVHKLIQITEKGLQKIASARVLTRTISVVNTLVKSTSQVFRGPSSRNFGFSSSKSNVKKSGDQYTFSGSQPTIVEDSSSSSNSSLAQIPSVTFADQVSTEPGSPQQVTRDVSLSHITSSLRSKVHRRTASLRSLASAQEIPYAELEEMNSPKLNDSPNVGASSSTNTTESEIPTNTTDDSINESIM